MALVCVDYMSRYDMRVSPPSESFGVLHIYTLCKVPDIFTDFFRHAFELQPAANLTVPISRELIRGEGAGRTVSSGKIPQKYALRTPCVISQNCKRCGSPDLGGARPDLYRVYTDLTVFSGLLGAASEHNH